MLNNFCKKLNYLFSLYISLNNLYNLINWYFYKEEDTIDVERKIGVDMFIEILAILILIQIIYQLIIFL